MFSVHPVSELLLDFGSITRTGDFPLTENSAQSLAEKFGSLDLGPTDTCALAKAPGAPLPLSQPSLGEGQENLLLSVSPPVNTGDSANLVEQALNCPKENTQVTLKVQTVDDTTLTGPQTFQDTTGVEHSLGKGDQLRRVETLELRNYPPGTETVIPGQEAIPVSVSSGLPEVVHPGPFWSHPGAPNQILSVPGLPGPTICPTGPFVGHPGPVVGPAYPFQGQVAPILPFQGVPEVRFPEQDLQNRNPVTWVTCIDCRKPIRIPVKFTGEIRLAGYLQHLGNHESSLAQEFYRVGTASYKIERNFFREDREDKAYNPKPLTSRRGPTAKGNKGPTTKGKKAAKGPVGSAVAKKQTRKSSPTRSEKTRKSSPTRSEKVKTKPAPKKKIVQSSSEEDQ